jgi:outer membrane biosynthesis protein TonB
MYFDFEDYRPDTPSLTAPMTRREAVLLALLLHAVLFIVYLITPASWFQVVRAVPVVPDSQQELTYTRVEPMRELPRAPKPLAPPSDLDRRSSTVEKPPMPKEPDPYSKGNTPDKVEGAAAEKMKGPESPTPSTSDASQASKPLADLGLLSPAPKPAGGNLGQSLKNLQQYLKDQNFDNQKGGQTDTDAAIQFDSKGVDFGSWLRRFEAQVRRNWFIPQSAMMLQGHVVLTFYVHKNGAITDLQILAPSTVQSFTMSSFNALKLSNPTVPLPPEYPDEKAFFTVTFLYNERIK